MSRTLALELSDDLYAAVRREAEASKTSPANWVATRLEWALGHEGAGRARTEAEKTAARERFERHFGEVSFGSLLGADNSQIDEDLAKSYADTHPSP